MACTVRARARHSRLERYVESQLANVVTHVDFVTDPQPQTELVLPGRATVPPAVETALALAGLGIDCDASGTQGDALVVVAR